MVKSTIYAKEQSVVTHDQMDKIPFNLPVLAGNELEFIQLACQSDDFGPGSHFSKNGRTRVKNGSSRLWRHPHTRST